MGKLQRVVSRADWLKEAERLFGKKALNWKFVCPACGFVARVQDWKDAGAPQEAVAFSCVGRWAKGKVRDAFGDRGQTGPCNYAGGGLININPVTVVDDKGQGHDIFEFAKEVDPS